MLNLALRVIFLIGVAFACQNLKAPVFSNTYSVKGTLYIPYADIKEPFYAWYNGKAGSSRIDYYGGMVKTYQLSRMGSYGSSLKIAPVTTETQENVQTCLQVNGSLEMKIKPQSIIPDTFEFQCKGTEIVDGQTCEKWVLTEQIGAKKNKYSLWIRYEKSPSVPFAKTIVPVMYEMRGYNTLLGSHYDHYYLRYEGFTDDVPSDDVFELSNNSSCVSFPGPGSRHVYDFNPMHEFIHHSDKHMENEFEIFKKKHGKSYRDKVEHDSRKNLFRQNMRFITSKNRANLGFQLAVNHLADKSEDEMKALRGKQYSPGYRNKGEPFPYDVEKEMANIPESMDWRLFGAVTPVKDQSVCGSCWSFGTTGTIEGAYFLKYGKLVRLSQQALIDCSWGFGNNGCDGGEDFRSYEWMMKRGGLPTEDDYGDYLGQDGYCHIKNVTLTARISGFVNVTPGDVNALKVAIAKHGPISISIDASPKTFSFYSNGVYYDQNCANTEDRLDHAVLAVGYGTMNGQGYWLVKNSWSNYWGNDGYILIAQRDDDCGVLLTPTYVKIK
jgi:C1A family cysteine protease